MEKINEFLYVIDEVTKPELAADSFIIKGNKFNYLFDCGNNEQTINEINELGVKYSFASHFHPDHIRGLDKIKCEKIYASKHTERKLETVEVTSRIEINDGVKLIFEEIPSSHSKGSCILTINNEITLLGDAIYPIRDMYNVTKLKETIEFIKNLDTKYLIMSHKSHKLIKKQVIIFFLERIYSKREQNMPLIKLEGNTFFN